jgi:anti-sigma B factor antagonist
LESTPLDVQVVGGDDGTRVVLTGELDLAGVPALEAALARVDEAGEARLVLDLRAVTFIDSSGIRCVLGAYHAALARGAELRIFSGLEAGVVFGLAGLSARLPLVADPLG